MNSKHIEAQFSAMGARFRTRIVPENRRGQSDYAMDIQRDRRGELFELRVPDSLSDQLEVNVLQVCPHERHLLLLVRRDRPERTLDRFLCGHDEREWFFVPTPALSPDPKLILRDEPIRRGSGKAHFVEMLYREGGTQVYACGQYPNGIIEAEYRRLVGQDPSRVKWGWRRMQRDAAVYARGQIRHPDHRTITLSGWHRVLMNTETHSRTMRQMAFLD
jgi:hypothetical protein